MSGWTSKSLMMFFCMERGQVRYDRTDDRPIDIVLVEAGMAHQAVQNDEVIRRWSSSGRCNPKRLHPSFRRGQQ
jgi:hypothetical protein